MTRYSFGAGNGSVRNVEVNLNSGSTGNNINFYNGATLNAFDGTYIDGAGSVSLNLNNGSVVNQSGGRILAGTLSIKGGSQYNLSGGTMGYDPDRLDHGQLDVTGELNVTGGLVNALGDVTGSGVVNVSGGEVRLERENRFFKFVDGGTLNLSGGLVHNIEMTSIFTRSGVINVSGGDIGEQHLGVGS